MRGGVRGFKAAALVDGHVDHHRAALHLRDHLAPDQLRRSRPRDQHRADDQIGQFQRFGHCPVVRGQRCNQPAVNVVQLAQTVQVLVDHCHVGAHADGDLTGRVAHHAAAQDHHAGRRHARYAAQQDPAPAIGRLQVLRTDLDRHAPGHFAHRRQQRQRPVLFLDRLIGDRRHPRFHELRRQLRQRRQMEIGEQRQVVAEVAVFGRLRLLDLDDQVRRIPDIGRRRHDARPGLDIIFVGQRRKRARSRLHHHLMARLHQRGYAVRHQADSRLVVFNFSRNTNDHGCCPSGLVFGFSACGPCLGPRPSAISVSESSLPFPVRFLISLSSWNFFTASTERLSQTPFGSTL